MGLAKTLFGVTLFSNDESETDETTDENSSFDVPTQYRVTWTSMEEVEKTTATIQFVSGKQKRVVYTNEPHGQKFVCETNDSEPIEVNWDNIEYIDTESVERVEVPTDRSGLFNSEELGEQLTTLYEEPSVISETVEWEKLK